MTLQNRIELLGELRHYLQQNPPDWQEAKMQAGFRNGWFTLESIDLAVDNIVHWMLAPDELDQWINSYPIASIAHPKNVGIVMAGNIPLVGFHDFLCAFVSGHQQTIKLSSKDDVLLKHLLQQLYTRNIAVQNQVSLAETLKGCDAYIATGSNNSARYFDYYFGRYPSIIRKNRTSVAVLTGSESRETLEKLSDDIHQFYGLGCRNVTHLKVPKGYDFVPLLESFHRYKHYKDHNKYRNNFDYHLSVLIMNNRFYMTNETTLLVENDSLFSPIAQVNYSFYTDLDEVYAEWENNSEIQCIAGRDVPYGQTQQPRLMDYADGVDTLQFLCSLK